jgi:hypothetical protein
MDSVLAMPMPAKCLTNQLLKTTHWFTLHVILPATTLQGTNTENLKQIFPEKELRGQSPNFHMHVSVSNL